MRAHLAAIFAVLVLVLSACPASALWAPDANECALLGYINRYRAEYGLAPVAFSRSLGMAADHHSAYMAATDDVDHSLGSVSWSQNILNYGYPAGYGMGENVLAGRKSAGGAFTLWLTSPAHRANILNPAWRAIGIGREVNLAGKYDYYWTATFGSVRHRTITCEA